MQELKLKLLRNIFHDNGYPDWLINKTINKFDQRNDNVPEKYERFFVYYRNTVFGKAFRLFSKRLCSFVKTKIYVDINVYYECFKTGSCFQLKCSTPFPLMSNVVYKFSCSRDANTLYIGMTTRHLGTNKDLGAFTQ